MAAPETRHLTILLTDIKGFTDKTSQRTRADIQAMLDEHRAIVLPILEGGGGKLIKTIGDAFLMTFDSPTNAVLAGVAVQEALAKRNDGRSADDRLEIRIAINAGEVNLVEGDVFGEPVNITARIEGIAEAGQVYFTEAVYLAMNKAEVPSSEVGLMQLKGIPEKIRVYKVRREEPVGAGAAAAAPADKSRLFGLLPPKGAAAPAAFGPGVKAIPAGSTALPSTWRRAVALMIDGLACSIIVSCFVGSEHSHRHRVKVGGAAPVAAPAAPAAPAAGLAVDQTGIHGSADGAKISIDAKGVQITPIPGAPGVAVDAGKKGVSVSVDDGDDQDSSERDFDANPFVRRFREHWAFMIVWFVYNLIFLKGLAATPGKKLMKLKVVSINGGPLEKRQRMMRSLFTIVSGTVMFLGYLWALWEPQKRGWHDLMADTRVVPE